ncbi:hypothetical protein KM043_015252 [Ampulex compressa]|nr:hypothetical protein KM043_015252 [Ampulex compressa]
MDSYASNQIPYSNSTRKKRRTNPESNRVNRQNVANVRESVSGYNYQAKIVQARTTRIGAAHRRRKSRKREGESVIRGREKGGGGFEEDRSEDTRARRERRVTWRAGISGGGTREGRKTQEG